MPRREALVQSAGRSAMTVAGQSKILRKWVTGLKQRTLLASVGVLVGGTGIAAVCTAATLPVLTRVYSPTDFGLLAALTGLISIASISACLRFDIAIPIPQHDADAVNVLALAVLSAGVVTVLISVIVLLASEPLLTLFGHIGILPFIWLLPVGVFAAALNGAMQSWLIRKKRFGLIARNRIMQAGVASGSQVAVGFAGAGTAGLLVGPTLGVGVVCLALAAQIAKFDRSHAFELSWRRMHEAFLTYRRFPKYSALEALANTASIQVPILMIAALAPASEAGYLLLAIFVVQAPIGLLGTAIGQVFLSHAPDEHRRGQLGAFITGIFRSLLKTGVGPLAFGGMLAPVLFAKVFGAEWQRSGVLLAWMTPWFVLQYLASPLSMALHIVNQQRAALLLQLYGLALRVAMVYAASQLATAAISEAYAVSGAVLYLSYLAVILHVTGIGVRTVAREVRASLLMIGVWVLAGIACLALLNVWSLLKSGVA